MTCRTTFFAALAYVLLSGTVHAQRMEDLLPKFSSEKNDSARFYIGFSGLTVSETNPVLDMHNANTESLQAGKEVTP